MIAARRSIAMLSPDAASNKAQLLSELNAARGLSCGFRIAIIEARVGLVGRLDFWGNPGLDQV
jgi:hypothetical protein